MTSLRVWVAFGLLSLAWGSSYLFIRIGVEHLSPLALVALRLVIGAAALSVFVALRRHRVQLSRRVLALTAVVATTNTCVPFLLITWGEETVPSGLASVLNSTVPIFSLVIAGAVLHDEPITLPRLGGVAIGFAGVLLLLSRDLSHGAIRWSALASQGAIVLASLCYAVSAVFTRKTLRGVPSMTISLCTLCIAAAETLLLSLIFSPPPLTTMNPSALFAVVWLGVLGSALAYLFYFFIIENWGAARTTLVTYVLPVVGLSLGAIFLGETVDWRILAGSALVIAGIVLANLVQRRKARAEPAAGAARRGVSAPRSSPGE
ncbi:MAG: EamA family transporter [Chloroflexi bacterium]|nr:EamA family transporter [Chloroflexota bacterium]